MTNSAKIVFIGIDAADKDLIQGWAQAGDLPTFQSLLGRSAWGLTHNPVGLYVGAIWPSFATSLSPARHGCYCYSQLHAGAYQTQQYSVFDLHGQMFWETLSQADRRVAVIDVPRTPPTQPLNGIQIVDWGTHDPDLPDKLYTWPEALAAEIEATYGRDPIGYCNAINRTAAGIQHFRDDLITRAHKKQELSVDILQRDQWDLFMTVFAESHCVGHQCWHLHDASHPKHDPQLAQTVGDPIKDVYMAIDRELGLLLAQIGPETTVIVLASHGMGAHYDGTFLLDDILCRLEGIEAPAMRQQMAKLLNSRWDQAPLLKGPMQFLKRYVWQPLRNRLWKSDKPLRVAMAEPAISRRKCFTLPNNDVYGAIRINLVGREPQGKVQPGAEYDDFCATLTHDLLDLVNVETGQPLVRRVVHTAEQFQGEYLDELPDLMVEWNRDAPIRKVSSPKIGILEKTFPGVRTGDHKPEGLFFAFGPHIQPGHVDPVSVMDFAPTIAAMLDVPLPGVDGQPIVAILPQHEAKITTSPNG